MLAELFSRLETLLGGSLLVVLSVSFVWGVLSILLSPCHLSGIPVALLSFQKVSRRPIQVPTLFALGISVSLVLIALLTFVLGKTVLGISVSSDWVMALVLLVSGVLMLELVPLNYSFRLPSGVLGRSYGPFVFGLIFGILVGPCTLAFAMPIIVASGLSSLNFGHGGVFIFASFGLGHLLATMIFGFSIQRASSWLNRRRGIAFLKSSAGVLLVGISLVFLYKAARG